jgi:hypothetical protein
MLRIEERELEAGGHNEPARLTVSLQASSCAGCVDGLPSFAGDVAFPLPGRPSGTTWSRSSKMPADTTLSRRIIVLPVYLLHAVDDTSDATAFDGLDRVGCHAVRERDEDLLLDRW